MSLRVGTGMDVIGFYLKKMIVPYPMGFYYGYSFFTPKEISEALPIVYAIIFLLLLIVAIVSIYFENHIVGYALLIVLITLFQVSTIFYPLAGVAADRYAFLPSIGFSIIVASAFYKAINSKWQKQGIAMLLLLIVYGGIVISRNTQWKDKITLFESDIKYLDKSSNAHALLGSTYMQEYIVNQNNTELLNLAAKQFERAIEIYPDFLNFNFDLARIYDYSQRHTEAIVKYQDAIKIDSSFSYEPYIAIATIYFRKNNYSNAAIYFEHTLVKNYRTPEIYNSLTQCYMQIGKTEEAIALLQTAKIYYPGNLDVLLNLGKIYYRLGRNQEALAAFISAQNINGDIPELNAVISEIEESL